MKNGRMTREELIDELTRSRRRIAYLERSELERKRVEEALSRSETTFRKITEKSIVGVYLIQDEIFRYINPKMAENFGYEVHELVDKKGPQNVVLEEDWPLVQENLRKRTAGEVEAINYRFRGVKRSGEIIHMEVYGSRTDYEGRPAVIGTILDITQRVLAERNLQMQLHRFQVLYHIAMAMAAERTLEENLALLVDKCRELLNTEASFIAVTDQSIRRMDAYAQSGMRRANLNRLPIECVTKQAVEASSGKPGDDAEACFAMLKTLGKAQLGREGLESGIGIPLQTRKTVIGVLCVGSRSKRAFSESEKDILSLIGKIAALEITRKWAEERFAQSENQLRLLSTQMLRAQEDERKRLAQELHDGIGQSLSAIKFKIESSMKQILEAPSPGDTASLRMLVSMIQGTIEEVQRIAVDLRPFILDDLGLVATLRWFLREFRNTYSDVRLDSQVGLKEDEVPESLKIVIFRITQEALNNVARHSRAERVQVALRKRKDRIELLIKDNGAGIDGDPGSRWSSCGKGFGLASMKERTELSGGVFQLDAGPGTGTSIRASWPLKVPATYR